MPRYTAKTGTLPFCPEFDAHEETAPSVETTVVVAQVPAAIVPPVETPPNVETPPAGDPPQS